MRTTPAICVLLGCLVGTGCIVSDGGTARPSHNSGNTANTSDQRADNVKTEVDAGQDGSNAMSNAAQGPGGGVLPYTLSPLGSPQTETAHLSLYFSVVDANDAPVAELTDEDFETLEDGQPLDRFESEFQVSSPTGSSVRIPTVLVLDLSRSVVEAGALETVKESARVIIDNLADEQELALLTFAGDVTVRSEFSTDKTALNAAVDEITDADGQSTNLYGALSQAYGMWSDGLREDEMGNAQLVAGLVIAISDGNDTAGVSSLSDVVSTRGSKRTYFVRVGEQIDSSIAGQIATVGVLDASFDDLDTTIGDALDRIRALNRSIYIAEYCSPKRAGEHELFFTVAGNQDFVEDTCQPSGTFPGRYCENPGDIACTSSVCCAPELPFYCPADNTCHETAAQVIEYCGAETCIACGVSEETGQRAGPAIRVDFSAESFSSEQCGALLD